MHINVSTLFQEKHMTVLEVIRDFLNDYGASSQEVFAQRKPKIVTERVFRRQERPRIGYRQSHVLLVL